MRPRGLTRPPRPRLATALALAVAGAGMLASVGWETLWSAATGGFVGLAPLYTRMDRGEILESRTRRTIYEVVQQDPGVCASEVADRAGVAWGTAVYHLQALEDNGYVVGTKHGRHRRWFENGGPKEADREALATLQRETTADVYETIREEPGLPQQEIAERVDMSPSALAWHVDRLREAGLVEKERDGRLVRHHPAGPPPLHA